MARNRVISIFLRVALACFLLVSLFGTFPKVAYAASFGVGDTVEVTTNLNVRTGPGTSYPEITDPDYPGYAPAGTQGQVLDGPTSADGYIWWKVDFGPGLYSGWSVEGGLEKVASTTVAARIDSYSPSSLVEVTVGGSTTISVTFTNTGNTAWNFIAGATVWDSGGSQVANYSKTLSSALQPGQQTTVSWTHPVNQAGDYWLQFGIWKATPYTTENLLDKKPSPSQNLIRGVVAPQPTIDYSPSSFSFSATQGGSNPSGQTLSIRNSGGGTLSWSVSDDAGWLSLSPTSGTSTGETDSVAVSVSISGMSAGSYSATITISASGATNTPQTVPVSLTISPASTVAARIDSYSPSSLVEVTVGGSTTISVTFTNTGNTAWNFIAGATVWDSGGSQVANYSKTLSSALQPGQQTTVSWTHPVNQAGDYWLQFGIWKATPYTTENLLDKKPSPSQNLIRGVVSANQSPTCSISANPRSGNAPLTVTFSISASDPDGAISAWVLDVDGDGNADYSGSGAPPSTKSHTYTNPGTYSVVLMVSDNKGASASDTETVNVGSANQPPNCSLSATPRSGNAPLTVTFSLSASDLDGSISAWAFDADGDGSTDYSGSGNPPSTQVHTYTNAGSYTAVLMVSDNKDATASDTETINVSPSVSKPDLVIAGITWSPVSPSIGDTITFTVTIMNQGTTRAGTSKVYYFIDNAQQGYDYVSSIDPDSTTTETFTWKAQEGSHTIKAVADYSVEVAESNETNNEKTVTYSATTLSDLIIESIIRSPTTPSIGDTLIFTVTIRNQGSGKAGSFKVYYFIDGVQQGYDSVYSLDPNATATETFTWSAEEGSHTVKAVADYNDEVTEGDETNNEKTVTLTPPSVLARIDSHSPVAPLEVKVGESVTLGVTFTNTGTTAWTFYAAASMRRPDGTEKHLQLKPVSLTSGEQGSATWSYTIDVKGLWDIAFGIWEEQEQVNSLDHTSWLNDYIICVQDDTSEPQVDSLFAQPSSITLGDSFTISYSVSDAGGSGLNRVELWRANDSNGSPADWVEITRNSASGNSDSGSFTDTPSSAGFYWYGIHVADNAGNWATEDSPVKVEVEAARITEEPYITSINQTSGAPGIEVTIKGKNFAKGRTISGEVSEPHVYFGLQEVSELIRWNNEEIVVKIPKAYSPKTVDVYVSILESSYLFPIFKNSNIVKFTYEPPHIDKIQPSSCFADDVNNTTVVIKGKHFGTEKGKVGFGLSIMSESDIVSWSDKEIIVKVPRDYGTGFENTKDAVNAIGLLFTVKNIVEKVGEKALREIIREIAEELALDFARDNLLDIFFNGIIRIIGPDEIETNVRVQTSIDWSNKVPFTYIWRFIITGYVASPCELRIYDSQRRVTGIVDGEVVREIPNSYYCYDTFVIIDATDSYSYEVVGTNEGTYGLNVTSVSEREVTNFNVTDVPTSQRAVHQYTVDWKTISEGAKGVTMRIDSDGDGTFEEVKHLAGEGGFSWMWLVIAAISGLSGVLVGALVIWRRIGRKKAV